MFVCVEISKKNFFEHKYILATESKLLLVLLYAFIELISGSQGNYINCYTSIVPMWIPREKN